MTIKLVVSAVAAMLTAGCAMQGAGQTAGAALQAPFAQLRSPDGSPRGTASIIQTEDGVVVRVAGVDLPAGVHGAHIHQVGRCDGPDFASAGPHWNPTGRQHGRDNPAGLHLGDLPNLTVGADGRGGIEYVVAGARARSGATPVLDADGAALVIHANADDYRTDPSGNSGGRIACAVLR